MSPRPNVSEQRKNQILDAAMQVFARLGFHKARMEDVAQEAGVSKGLLYWYYKNKDAIIAAILDRLFSQEMRHLHNALAASGPVTDRLLALSRETAQHMLSLKFLVPIAFEFYALAGRNAHVRSALQQYYTQYRQNLMQLIEEGIASGEFREDTQAEAVAQTIIALFEGLVLLWVVDPEQVPLAEQIEQSFSLIVRSIRAEGNT